MLLNSLIRTCNGLLDKHDCKMKRLSRKSTIEELAAFGAWCDPGGVWTNFQDIELLWKSIGGMLGDSPREIAPGTRVVVDTSDFSPCDFGGPWLDFIRCDKCIGYVISNPLDGYVTVLVPVANAQLDEEEVRRICHESGADFEESGYDVDRVRHTSVMLEAISVECFGDPESEAEVGPDREPHTMTVNTGPLRPR